jgi:uncharacterized damage-inducible protein DinB
MSVCALTCAEMLAYNQDSANRWERWLVRNPAALDVPCDVMNVGTVRMLVQHIFAVELRFSQRLMDEAPADYANLPADSLERLIGIHNRATANFETFLATANGPMMEEVLEFVTRTAGTLRASRRSMFVHAMVHSIRHWAQLATLLRQHGMKTDWAQDYLVYAAVK